MTGKRRDAATIQKAVALHAKGGLSVRQVAKEVKVNHATVARWVKDPAKFLGQAKSEKVTAPKPSPEPIVPGDDGVDLEYTPEPKLVGHKEQKEPTTCGNCKAILDDLGQPTFCPGCGYRLEWA